MFRQGCRMLLFFFKCMMMIYSNCLEPRFIQETLDNKVNNKNGSWECNRGLGRGALAGALADQDWTTVFGGGGE